MQGRLLELARPVLSRRARKGEKDSSLSSVKGNGLLDQTFWLGTLNRP